MEKITVKEIRFERGKWAERDLERKRKIQRNHILVTVVFEDEDGNEVSWCPYYVELDDIFLHLITLHGEDEVFESIMGGKDTITSYKKRIRTLKKSLKDVL